MVSFKKNATVGIILILLGVGAIHVIESYNLVPLQYRVYLHVAATILLSIIVVELIGQGIRHAGTKVFAEEGNMLADLFRLVCYSIVLILVLYEFKINVTGLLVGAGFLGIVIGLAAQNTLGNILSGLEIIVAKPFKIGERITISTWQYGNMPPSYPHDILVPGFSGVVEKVGIVYSSLISEDNTRTYIPNGILIQAVVLNHNRSKEINFRQRVELTTSKDFSEFKKLLLASIKSSYKSKAGMVKNLRIEIDDINNGYYGVGLYGRSKTEEISEAEEMLKEASIIAINKMGK